MSFYRKKKIQEITPWIKGLPMDLVSVSEEDKLNGSPKAGDQIAIGDSPTDMWLISEKFFVENYEWVSD